MVDGLEAVTVLYIADMSRFCKGYGTFENHPIKQVYTDGSESSKVAIDMIHRFGEAHIKKNLT